MATSGNKNTNPNNEKQHPVDAGDLLALIRDQPFAKRAFVRQHLAECVRCQQNYASLTQASKALDVVGQIAMYQRYPELSPSLLLKNGQLGYSQRRFSGRRTARYEYNSIRPRSSAMRLAIPAAMVIFLMTVTIMIGLAKFGLVLGSEQVPKEGTSTSHRTMSTGIAKHQLTPTIVVTVTSSAGDTTKDMPTIINCTTPRDAALHILVICGSDFTPGHKAVLFITYDGRSQMSSYPVQVSTNGKFFYHLFDISCKDIPISMYARDITSKSSSSEVSSNKLVGLAVSGCASSSPKAGRN